ncbi:MAG: SCP2 sterol-binding domain-containing protein, partial [Anaerolineae bacterium]|nr:SCP2 sterol-binding domain-containing protein [Anaerolineae bacterium]
VAPLATTRLTEDVLPPDLLDQLKPEFVVPLVLYFCSEQCADSGLVLNAGMGHYSRSAVISAPGVVLVEGDRAPDLADIHQNWARIDSLRGARTYDDANAMLMSMLTGPADLSDEPEETEAPAPAPAGAAGSVQAVFDNLPGAFQAGAAAGVSVVFQFSISGPGGGEWYAAIDNGALTVALGTHSKPTTTLKMSDDDFLKYVGGQLPAMQAYSAGKLKIEGDLMKSQLVEKLFKFR